MGMDVGGSDSGLRADINVVPMVDIMLVLLIIFMVVAPMLSAGVSVRLPEAVHTVDKPETQGQTVIAITPNGRFHVNGIETREAELAATVTRALDNNRELIVLIKGDADAPYGAIMAAMDQLREAEIENIGLITETKRVPGQQGGGK
jgi:biopolymer transport protein ExbD